MPKYSSVNGEWPDGTNDGRDLKPTPQEAVAGVKRLYRIAMGKPWKGKVALTSGNRHTWTRRGVLYVNPDEGGGLLTHIKSMGGVPYSRHGGGWHEIVHSISHLAARRLYRENHGARHAFIERELIKAVVNRGWLEGKLAREPRPKTPKPAAAEARLARIQERLVGWQRRQKRAATAIRKLERQLRYYQKKTVPTVAAAGTDEGTGLQT